MSLRIGRQSRTAGSTAVRCVTSARDDPHQARFVGFSHRAAAAR